MRIINFCIRYKYILTVATFVAYLIFGENSISKKRQLNKEIKELKTELQYYKSIVENIKTQKNLSSISSKEDEEEYFRKYHFLKKEDEDVFRLVYVDNKDEK